jgi:3-phosphoshikimate 1-carboxyvinyltransferase
VAFEFLEVPGKMPFILKAKGLPGGDVSVDIQDSSQFLSGLLIAAPLSQQGMVLRSNQMIAKKPYVLMTLELMAKFGVQHEVLDDFSIQVLPQKYQPTKLAIEPDASTASYFFAAAALTKSSVIVEDLGMDSLQGDMRFLEVLERMGCKVTRSRTSSEVSGPQMFNALNEVDVTGFSDTFMTLSIMAPFLPTPTKIIGLRHTRLQESDRVAAMVDGLKRVGIRTEDTEDSLTIFPGTPVGAEIDSHRDHRIAMSFGVMGLVVPGMSIAGAECVSKTCPEFFDLLVGFSRT